MSKQKLKRAQERVKVLTNVLYDIGDQDECSMKHVGHGIAMLIKGKDPAVQDNYVDWCYRTSGFSKLLSFYDDSNKPEDEDESVLVESGFQGVIWREIKNLYDEFGDKLFNPSHETIPYVKYYKEFY